MPDVLESAVLESLRASAETVLSELRTLGRSVDYRDYLRAMRRRGFSDAQARDAFFELPCRVTSDLTIVFAD